MKYFLRDKELTKVLEARNVLLKKSKEFVTKREEIDKELMKIGYKLNPLKEKTLEITKDNEETIKQGSPLEEFEYIAEIGLERGVPTILVKDQIEDYRELLRDKKDNKKVDAGNSKV